MYKAFKRFSDIVISLFALIILSPLMLFTALAIKLDSKGPVIFKQERLGYKAKVFHIYKFRSMCENAEQMGTGQYSFAGDMRVTKVGKFIRATSIDELPQLINVLKGEMSLVGFRPPLTYHPWDISEYTDEQLRMFDVRPGITGWAQVNGRKHTEWHERIRLNVYYVDHISLFLDIKILFMTVFSVLKNEDNVNVTETVRGTAADINANNETTETV
ncbi:MAG TPA: sugar transferase [Ruminococcaceae bacterium]|nr:sugar transferase [Oscillospiraceae bacterium]